MHFEPMQGYLNTWPFCVCTAEAILLLLGAKETVMAVSDIAIVVCLPIIALGSLAYLWRCAEPLSRRFRSRNQGGYWEALIEVLESEPLTNGSRHAGGQNR